MARPQLSLFAPEAPKSVDPERVAEDARLAGKLHPRIHLGPSSWTFPGWAGIVYPSPIDQAALVDHGLGIVARHPLMRTVGIDRSYYAPIPDDELAHYARDLPPSFPCVIKAWSAVTTRNDPRSGARNPTYLDLALCEREVLLPLARSFPSNVGALVFQLAPIPEDKIPRPDVFAGELDRFLGALPSAFPYAVEIRNRELFTAEYLDVLARHRVAHVLSLWERMPPLGAQLDVPGVLTAPHVVARLSIPPGNRYDERRAAFAPFDKIVRPDEASRRAVARLVDLCVDLRRTLLLTVNNKVEGSSPLTIRAYLERITRSEIPA